jgi:hypothetical protein
MNYFKTVIVIIGLIPATFFGQKKMTDTVSIVPKRNTIYIELGGQSLIGSLNYDRLFRVNKKVKTSFSAGFGTFGDYTKGGYDEYYSLPLSYNFLFGKKNSHLELGIGIVIFAEAYLEDYSYDIKYPTYIQGNDFYTNQIDIATYITPKIGYRFQKPKGGFFFKVAFTPLLNFFNRQEGVKKNGVRYEPSTTDWFTGGLDIMPSAMPWLGISLGYTIK